MKTLIAVPLLLSLSVSSVAQTASSFDFLGFRTDTASAPISSLAGKKCKVAQVGPSKCNIFAGAILGRARPINVTVTFANARLIAMSGYVLPHFYSDLVEAFETKYGPASTTETRKWQNQAGSTFDNTVRRWIFTNGTLELRERGSQRDVGEFDFVASDLPEELRHKKPPVNF